MRSSEYAYDNFVNDSAGYGLAQWTYPSRKNNLLNHARQYRKSIGDLDMQLNFFWKELQGYTLVMPVLKNATSVKEASDIMLTKYERPKDQSDKAKERRAGFGQKYYNKYASKSSNTTQIAPSNNVELPAVGDIVNFTGDEHFSSSNSTTPKKCLPGRAKVTALAKGTEHPVHLVAVASSGSNVYGWVDTAFIAQESTTLKVGAKVKVNAGAKTYTGGNLASFVYKNTYDVLDINGNRVVIGIGKAVTAAVNKKDLTVV